MQRRRRQSPMLRMVRDRQLVGPWPLRAVVDVLLDRGGDGVMRPGTDRTKIGRGGGLGAARDGDQEQEYQQITPTHFNLSRRGIHAPTQKVGHSFFSAYELLMLSTATAGITDTMAATITTVSGIVRLPSMMYMNWWNTAFRAASPAMLP